MLSVKKCLIFGQIFKFVFVVSKPLNRLISVAPFYKWEAIIFHHIFSDLFCDFGKGPKRRFKKTLFWTYFLPREDQKFKMAKKWICIDKFEILRPFYTNIIT